MEMTMDGDAFAAFPPAQKLVDIAGEQIDVTPLRVGELPAFARAVRPVAAKISADPDWLSLLADDGEAVIAAVAIACRRPPEWVSALALDDAIRLAEEVFAANADFFVRKVAPQIARASQTVGALISGRTQSSD